MTTRTFLLMTTALASGGAVWMTPPASAADMTPVFKAPPMEQFLPAVSAPNFKISGFGGTAKATDDRFVNYRDDLFGGEGSFTVPVARNWGLQGDGTIGSWGGDRFFGAAGHFFWRDPNKPLFGIYGSTLWLDRGP